MGYYAVTVKKNGKELYVHPQDYTELMEYLEQKNILICRYVYELDSSKRLHVHLTVKGNPYQHLPKKIFHTHVRYLRSKNDLAGWHSYLTKDINKEPAIIMNEIYHKNCFI